MNKSRGVYFKLPVRLLTVTNDISSDDVTGYITLSGIIIEDRQESETVIIETNFSKTQYKVDRKNIIPSSKVSLNTGLERTELPHGN